MSGRVKDRRAGALRAVVWAAVATAAAAAFYAASYRVPALKAVFDALGDERRAWVSFFYRRWDLAGDPGVWLRLAVVVVTPALLWAVAFARLAPRAALRLAGLLSQRWFVAVVIALSTLGVIYFASAVLGNRALEIDEQTYLFQSKVFARGRLAAPALAADGDLDNLFFATKIEIIRDGRWFSMYSPLHPFLLMVGAKLGWAKLVPAALAPIFVLLAVFGIGWRVLGPFGGGVAVILAAASPFFLVVQASYESEATFLLFFALAAWCCVRVGEGGGERWWGALGLAAGAAFLAREYSAVVGLAPLTWYLWRRRRAFRGRNRWAWFGVSLAGVLSLWFIYNRLQTGNPFVPPRFFSIISHFGFDDYNTPVDSLSSWARNLFVLSTDSFGWPLVCLAPAFVRLFLKPRPCDFEKALYGVVLANFVAQIFVKNVGITFGARYYYGAWFALLFPTAQFFVIIATRAPRAFARAGEGVAALLLVALLVINGVVYLPKIRTRYAGYPWDNVARWADADVRRAVAALGLSNAVVIIKPRRWCFSSTPCSPFFD